MKYLKIKLFVIAMVMFAATSAFASYSFDFNVDTSSILGQSGYIDLQFNPGTGSAGLASAVVTSFTSNATLGVASPTGGVTGTLPAAVTITNTTPFNDYFQAITFGNAVSFDLNMSSVPGNSFSLSFFGS